MKILLAEDDARLGRTTQELLSYENFSVDLVEDGSEAVSMIRDCPDTDYDLILLDWMLPEISGIEVCKLLRGKYKFQGGIIFVTARGEMDDCICALDSGAADFIDKPFKIKELVARINAVCRRKNKPFVDRIFSQNGIEINSGLDTVSCGGTELCLRRKEFALFEILFVNLNHTIPRGVIFEKVWNDRLETNPESLDSHIYTLRKNLKIFPQIQIRLVKNIGYKMELEQ